MCLIALMLMEHITLGYSKSCPLFHARFCYTTSPLYFSPFLAPLFLSHMTPNYPHIYPTHPIPRSTHFLICCPSFG